MTSQNPRKLRPARSIHSGIWESCRTVGTSAPPLGWILLTHTPTSRFHVCSFRDLLLSLQPEEDNSKRDDANKVVLKSLAPAVHVEDLLKMLRDACRSVGVATSDPYGPAKGLQTALEITDAILARLPEVNSERKRLAAACEAFRKVFAKA